MSDTCWEIFSPMNVTFRAFGVEENREQILKAVENAMEQFRHCEQIQIEITAPPRDPGDNPRSGESHSNNKSGRPIVMGFAGGE